MSTAQSSKPNFRRWFRALRGPALFALTLLAIEFLDEFVYGAGEAAWPLIRTDLALTYAQIGLLLGLPRIVGNLIEPTLGILGDVWKRRALILGGGVIFTASLLLTGVARNFAVLLAAFILFYPASGAFVSLSQATLMDSDPERHEHLMARWTLAGSLGVVAGPLALGAAAALGLGWRGLYFAFAVLAVGLTLIAWRQPFDNAQAKKQQQGLRRAVRNAVLALRRKAVLRWLVLLEFSDFMLDVLLGFLALYFVDVVGVTPALAGAAVAVWAVVGLVGDALLIPLLERVRGVVYLRWSALVMLFLYPAFLLAPSVWIKIVLLAALGLGNSGWYAILQGRLYSEMPGQSGTVMAINSAFGVTVGIIPALLGFAAERFGLSVTMWLLILGPVALLVGLPTSAVDRPLLK
jgi:MFS transporter, FSR family, fosmidomycin resistance protein